MTCMRALSVTGPAVALALACVWASEVRAQDSTAADQVTRGARVYGAVCGSCHNARSPLERSDRQWVTISNHMQVRANLVGSELRAVLAFLQASNADPTLAAPAGPGEEVMIKTGPPSTDPTVIAQGKSLVEAKGCVGCHVIGNTGGAVGPRLNTVVKAKGAQHVRQKLHDPTFNNANSLMPNFKLTSEQIEAITAYLATFQR